MFESDLDKNARKMQGRTLLALSASAVGGMVLGSLRTPGRVAAAVENVPGEATIVEFSDDGKKLKKVRVAKVVKTEAEWKKLLSPNAFDVTQHADTEMAFTGKYWNLHEKGFYRCICCDNALFGWDRSFHGLFGLLLRFCGSCDIPAHGPELSWRNVLRREGCGFSASATQETN